MKTCKSYDECIGACEEFLSSRDLNIADSYIQKARLYVGAFRSLDIYKPVMESIQNLITASNTRMRSLMIEDALTGLKMLYSFRYRPIYNDHRILPQLFEYHQMLRLVDGALSELSDVYSDMRNVYANFTKSIERITMSEGIYVVNWKDLPDVHFTYYSRVGLRIARILAVDSFGMYVVRFRGDVPIHLHRYLEEHHFLPERVNGLHYLNGKLCRTTETDILYIKNGQAHGFKCLEDNEKSFLFICGSEKTGPWDFIQDIEVLRLDYSYDRLYGVDEIGGKDLTYVLERFREKKELYHERLSPDVMRLFHDCVKVIGEYTFPSKDTDLIIYVVEGSGELRVNGLERDVKISKGEAFSIFKGLEANLKSDGMIIYQFGYI